MIPPRANRSSPRGYDRPPLYGALPLIANFFAKIKQFRAIATRAACPRAGEAGPVGEDRAQLPGRSSPHRQRRLAREKRSRQYGLAAKGSGRLQTLLLGVGQPSCGRSDLLQLDLEA